MQVSKILPLTVRFLLGALFLVFGANKLLHFIPQPPLPPSALQEESDPVASQARRIQLPVITPVPRSKIRSITQGDSATMACGRFAGMWTHVPGCACISCPPRRQRACPFIYCIIAGTEAVCSDSSCPAANAMQTAVM
jgi:hypothetical protein